MIVYLDLDLMKKMCHPLAVAIFDRETDPIPPFTNFAEDRLDASLQAPKHAFGGTELYPAIHQKAAVLFYSMIQNHPFQNGNKRLGAASMLVFLYMNGMWLRVSNKELAQWAIRVASSGEKIPPERMDVLLPQLTRWIEQHLVESIV